MHYSNYGSYDMTVYEFTLIGGDSKSDPTVYFRSLGGT